MIKIFLTATWLPHGYDCLMTGLLPAVDPLAEDRQMNSNIKKLGLNKCLQMMIFLTAIWLPLGKLWVIVGGTASLTQH